MPGGILNVYKPVGMTSFEITERVGKILGEKAGHTGTLDPFARGVMVICWGKATRLASFSRLWIKLTGLESVLVYLPILMMLQEK